MQRITVNADPDCPGRAALAAGTCPARPTAIERARPAGSPRELKGERTGYLWGIRSVFRAVI